MPKPRILERNACKTARWLARCHAWSTLEALSNEPPPPSITGERARSAWTAEYKRVASILDYKSSGRRPSDASRAALDPIVAE
jgi:hypothetical protein